ncbi:MAG: hypothetical protein VX641_06045 [Planctomycetota bacterium]|nr:hypothetical protein [Planctomycetota bacterium]
MKHRVLSIIVFCLLLTAAQAEEIPADRPSEAFELDFTATAWFPRLTGTFAIGPGGTTLDVETDTFLHGSEVAFNGEADLRSGAWTFHIAGSEFSTSGNGVLDESIRVAGVDLIAGSLWRSSYDQWTIEAEADLAIWRPFADEPFPWSSDNQRSTNLNQDGDYLVDLRINGRLGYRYTHVRQTFDSSTANLRSTSTAGWSAVVLGIIVDAGIDTRPLIPFLRELEFEAGASASPVVGGGSGYLFGVQATLRAYLFENAALVFGFRLQGTNASAGEYDRNGSVMGLVAGATIRF